jgi:hypothetical protein
MEGEGAFDFRKSRPGLHPQLLAKVAANDSTKAGKIKHHIFFCHFLPKNRMSSPKTT